MSSDIYLHEAQDTSYVKIRKESGVFRQQIC